MAHDALDPGPGGTFPHFPRGADGSPLWSRTEATDGEQINGVTPMPTGTRVIRRNGTRLVIDVTPRDTDGQPIEPPTLSTEG